MSVKEFIELLQPEQQQAIQGKIKPIATENVMHGGNDIWLADELGMNRLAVEELATSKRKL